jgi:DNA excision repair protein ERCC-3
MADIPLAELLSRNEGVAKLLEARLSPTTFRVSVGYRGLLKQALLAAGYPAEDLAGYESGAALPLSLRQETLGGFPFTLRDYQQEAAAAFYTLVSLRTCEEDFARHRQLFLAEQGYSYQIQVLKD